MIDVGILGLDTSHPPAFAEKLTEKKGTTITGVWDGGDVREPEYAEDFCRQFGATRYEDPHEMIDGVDAVMVLTVNWDSHADLATPFLEADVPTFVDKPLAGTVDDLVRMEAAVGESTLFGGSAVPFHPALDGIPTDEANRTLYCAGYYDPFYYGAHLAHVVRGFVGADWTSVEPKSGPGIVVEATFENSTRATMRFDGSGDEPAYGILDVGERTRTRRVGGDEQAHQEMYERFLDAFVEVVSGDRDDSADLLDGASLLLAAHAALENGTTVRPGSEVLRDFHADGEAFLAEYASAQ